MEKKTDDPKEEKHKCFMCGKLATIFDVSGYLAELHPETPNPREWWCEECNRDDLDNI